MLPPRLLLLCMQTAPARSPASCVDGHGFEYKPLTAMVAARRRERVVDQVVIGTHGSLKNWVSKRILPLAAIRILVFDEADHMLQVPCDWLSPVHMSLMCIKVVISCPWLVACIAGTDSVFGNILCRSHCSNTSAMQAHLGAVMARPGS